MRDAVMKPFKIYIYTKCQTCQKALKFLTSRKIIFFPLPIRETPPSLQDLRRMSGYLKGDIRALFNTAGQDYRVMNLKEQLKVMSELEKLTLLSKYGNLIKRPFVIGEDFGLIGFEETTWRKVFN